MNVKSAMTAIARKHLFVLVIKCKEKVVVQQNENEKTLVFQALSLRWFHRCFSALYTGGDLKAKPGYQTPNTVS